MFLSSQNLHASAMAAESPRSLLRTVATHLVDRTHRNARPTQRTCTDVPCEASVRTSCLIAAHRSRLRLARTSSSATRCRTEINMGSVILSGGAQRRSRRIPLGDSREASGCRRAGSFAPASRGLPAPASRAREFDSPLGCRMLALAQDGRGADLPSVGFGSTADEALAVHFLPQCCVSRRAQVDGKNATWGNSMQARRKPCRNATLRRKVHIPGGIRR